MQQEWASQTCNPSQLDKEETKQGMYFLKVISYHVLYMWAVTVIEKHKNTNNPILLFPTQGVGLSNRLYISIIPGWLSHFRAFMKNKVQHLKNHFKSTSIIVDALAWKNAKAILLCSLVYTTAITKIWFKFSLDYRILKR